MLYEKKVCIVETSYYYVNVEVDDNATDEEITEAAEQQFEEIGADECGEVYIEASTIV